MGPIVLRQCGTKALAVELEKQVREEGRASIVPYWLVVTLSPVDVGLVVESCVLLLFVAEVGGPAHTV